MVSSRLFDCGAPLSHATGTVSIATADACLHRRIIDHREADNFCANAALIHFVLKVSSNVFPVKSKFLFVADAVIKRFSDVVRKWCS